MEQLVRMNQNDKNLTKTINRRVIPVPGYVMNVSHLNCKTRGNLKDLDKIVKREPVLREKNCHERK